MLSSEASNFLYDKKFTFEASTEHTNRINAICFVWWVYYSLCVKNTAKSEINRDLAEKNFTTIIFSW